MGKTTIKEAQSNIRTVPLVPDFGAVYTFDDLKKIGDDKEMLIIIYVNGNPGLVTIQDLKEYLGI